MGQLKKESAMTASTTDKGPATTNLRRLHPASCAPRRAFTLVEMLVVITIIGILASLATVAAYKALEAAKRARITAEIANLDAAAESLQRKIWRLSARAITTLGRARTS